MSEAWDWDDADVILGHDDGDGRYDDDELAVDDADWDDAEDDE